MPRAPSRAQGVTSHAVAGFSTSAGVTPPSSLLRAHAPVPLPPTAYGHGLGQQVLAGRCQPRLPMAPSRRSSANLSLRAWTPTPAALMVHLPVSSHQTSAFPTLGPGRRFATPTRQLQCGRDFEAAVIRLCSSPQVCSPPRLLLPRHLSAPGSRGFYVPACLSSLPPRAGNMLAFRFGQLTAEGLPPSKIRSLVGCSLNACANRRANSKRSAPVCASGSARCWACTLKFCRARQ